MPSGLRSDSGIAAERFCSLLCRLYFEARGEVDLRHPSASSVGHTVHRGGGGAEERRRLEERLQQLQDRCGFGIGCWWCTSARATLCCVALWVCILFCSA